MAPLDPALAAAVDSDDPRAIEAVVVHGPEETTNGTRLVVALTALDGAPARGTLALSVANGWPDFGPGETIACRAKLRALRGTRNPGLPDPALALRAVGIDALAGVPTAGAIRRLAEPSGFGPRRAAYLARRAMRDAIDRAVDGPAGAFLKTAVLGDRRGVAPEVEEGFRAAGATHVLSVSGLHLAAVAALFFLLVRGLAARVPGLPLYVDPRAIAAAASLPAIAFFTLLTGEAVATERSALMLALGMGALLVGRAASPGPTIAGAALVLLIARPLQIFDVSLQLSVASVAGIALCARRLGPGGRPGDSIRQRACGGSGASARRRSPRRSPRRRCARTSSPRSRRWRRSATWRSSRCARWWSSRSAWRAPRPRRSGPPLGRWPLALAAAAARLALAIAAGFRAHAPVWVCRAPNALETFLLIAAGALALVAPTARGGSRRLAVAAAVACAVVASSSLVIRDLRRRFAETLTVTFLDVGQGDAAVVEAPGGAVMLIDGGGTRDGQFDTGARIVEPFLRARGISRLDVVALSHPHPDHLNGLFRILQRFPVGAFWSSGDDGRNPEYRRLVALAAARGVPTPEVTPTGARRRAGRAARAVPRRTDRGPARAHGQRRLARPARRVRRTVGAVRRAISRLTEKGSSRPAVARSDGEVGRAQGSAPRQPDVVERRAARRGRARAGGDVARLAQPVPLSGARGPGPLRGARGPDAADRSRRRRDGHRRAGRRPDRGLRARVPRRATARTRRPMTGP